MKLTSILLFAILITGCNSGRNASDQSGTSADQVEFKTGQWVSLFNGKNLDGWIPKVAGDSAGVNTLDVFRVENGLLRISYDKYDKLDNRYGHLFYEKPFSRYKIRFEYRFVGEVLQDAPSFCYRNSGVMIHSQSPESMGVDQYYPVSLEIQLLGSTDSVQQRTSNLCTPGTTIFWKGEKTEEHIIPSTSEYYVGDQWVTIEVTVDGSRSISSVISGDTVLNCSTPQVGGFLMPDDYPVPVGTIVDNGYIALQAEGQPIDFRKIELMKLGDE